MRWIFKLRMKIAMLLGRGTAASQMDRELQFHLDQLIDEKIASGIFPTEARRLALREFGNPIALRDQTRSTWHWNQLEIFALDIRQSFRGLVHTPSFSLVAIVVLAIGIGANIALFAVVHAVLLKALPFPDSSRLVRLYEADSHGAFQDNTVAGGTYTTWRERARSFDGMALKGAAGYSLAASTDQAAEFVKASISSWNLFVVLGVHPALGRFFREEDDRPGADPTVILTWGLWKRRYGGDPSLVGKAIQLDARSYKVIGILPEGFTYPDAKVQLWTPIFHEKSAGMMRLYDAHDFDVVARLKPSVSIEQASSELSSIQRQIRLQHPEGAVNDAANIRPILDAEVRNVRTSLYALLAATGCLLLIACLNIANLLIARSSARRRELAIRAALGGSRLRLLRSHVLEGLLLATAAGGVGLVFANIALHWLVSTRTDIPRAESIHLDFISFFFTAGVVLLCGAASGLIAASSFRNNQILKALQEASRSQTVNSGRARIRRILLSLEVALTIVLLVGAGLLLKTYQHLRSADLGCTTTNILTMDITLPKATYPMPRRVAFFEQLQQQVQSLPGVRTAGMATVLPSQGLHQNDVFAILEHPPLPRSQFLVASTIFVDPEYFTAMQIPLLRGRFLQSPERLERATSVLVNQAFARQYFPHEDPLGKHVVSFVSDDPITYQIVGVVGDTREYLSKPAPASIYFPLYMGTERSFALVIRTVSAPLSLSHPVESIVAHLDPNLPVANVLTMNQLIGEATLESSFDALLLLTFALISLILAAIGLFGVLSFIVGQRTAEIGIRLALGAERGQIIRLVLIDGMRPALFGVFIGLAASLATTRLIQSMLFDIPPVDSTVYLLVTTLLLVVAAGACLLPAWRASRLEPMIALRTE